MKKHILLFKCYLFTALCSLRIRKDLEHLCIKLMLSVAVARYMLHMSMRNDIAKTRIER